MAIPLDIPPQHPSVPTISHKVSHQLSLQKLIKSVLIISKDSGIGYCLMCSKRFSTKCVVTEYWQITKEDLDNPKNGSESKHWVSIVGVPLEEWADKNGSRVGTQIQRQACTPGWHFYLDGWGERWQIKIQGQLALSYLAQESSAGRTGQLIWGGFYEVEKLKAQMKISVEIMISVSFQW